MVSLLRLIASALDLVTGRNKDWKGLLLNFWIGANLVGAQVFAAKLQVGIVQVTDGSTMSTKSLAETILAMLLYLAALTMFTTFTLSCLVSAILDLKRELYGAEDAPIHSSNRVVPRSALGQNPITQGNQTQQSPRMSMNPRALQLFRKLLKNRSRKSDTPWLGIARASIPAARPPTPPPKPKTITEIPQYLLKISSTLFKKATAAEIFLSRLENKRRVLNSRKKDQEQRAQNLIKVSSNSQTRATREQFVQNLISEPSANLVNRSQRRKSIEVLMTENVGTTAVVGGNTSFNRQVPEMIESHGAIPDLNKSISKKSELQSPAEPIEREMGAAVQQPNNKSSHKRKRGDKNSDQNKGNPDQPNLHELSFKSEQMIRQDGAELEPIPAEDLSVSKHSNAENLCTVCFVKEPNTVFMPCGHGGICDECALGIFEKSDQCPFCRK